MIPVLDIIKQFTRNPTEVQLMNEATSSEEFTSATNCNYS